MLFDGVPSIFGVQGFVNDEETHDDQAANAERTETGDEDSYRPTVVTTTSWREWSGREDDQHEGYRFGDITRGLVSSLQSGVRELQHKAADAALSLKEGHEQRATEFVRSHQDEEVREKAQVAASTTEATAAERFWCGICKDIHRSQARV